MYQKILTLEDTQSVKISQKQDGHICNHEMYIYIYIYIIMKTMCPPDYHHNGFAATHALEHMYIMYPKA